MEPVGQLRMKLLIIILFIFNINCAYQKQFLSMMEDVSSIESKYQRALTRLTAVINLCFRNFSIEIYETISTNFF